ncbi:MAG: hypothetical protein LBC07_05275, partial [Elusimicrobiota bacterium]|nr:hypothetical protein [Elusimicrobiota bacterium]
MFFKKLQSYCWRYFCDIDFSCKLQAIIAGFFKSVRAVSLCLFLFVFLFIAKLSYAIDVDSFKSLKALLESNIDYSAEIIKFNLSISTDSNFSANPILIGANKTIDGQGQYSFSFANSSVSKTNAASVIDNQALHVLTFQNFNLIIFKDNYSNPPTSSLERWGIVSNVGAKINFAASSIAFLNNVSGNYVGGTISNRSNSTMTFSNVSITFASNASGSGAAFENADASLITFENSTTVFMDNKSWMDGAVNNIYGAIINIANSNFIFDSNEGFLYGAISNWNGNGTDGAASLIKVSNSQISFKDNYAGMWGGAIYNDYGSLTAFVNSKIDFTKNGAGNVGGAIYNGQNSSVTFINSSVNFIENYVDGSTAAGVGGFAIYNDSTSLGKGISYMLFSGSTVNFSGNKYQGADKYYGEAVYNTGTLIFENSKINFTNVANSTSIYQNGGSLKISRGEISFSSHTNISWTFANNYSNIIFNPSIAAFYNNSSKIGGGGSTMTDIFTIIEKVRNGRLLAYQNINTTASGGFLHIGNRSVAFGAVTFSSNSTTAPKDSGYGGAVNVLNSSVSFFSDNQDSIFDYNTAVKGGGAFNVDKSTIYFLSAKGKVLFDQNRSPTDSAGAALIYFSNAIFENVSFTSNTAGADSGALSVNSNAKVWINQKENINTQSYGNRAGSYGGAINVDAGLLTFNLLANSSMHFYDNIAYYGKANQMQNDLSLNLAASSAVFNVAGGASLIFDSGIRAANGGFIGKFGTGSLSLGGDNYFNNLTQPFSPTGQFNVSNSTFTWIMGNNKTNFLAANNSNVTFTNSSVSFITIAGESSLSVQTSAIDIAKYFAEDNSQVLFKFINSNVLIKDRIHAVDAKANGSGIYINTRGQLNSSLRFYFEGGSLSVINTSASWGSALYVRGNEKSIVDFSTTTVFFKDNISFLGSAIFLGTVKSKINFFNVTKSSFISNITTLAGGAIFLTDQSAFKVMGNSEIYFISNVSSGIGGAAVYLEDNSLSAFKVENSSMYFSKNISTNTGGALYIGSSNSFTVNNSYLNFSSNSAQEFGGAIYINENAALSFINSNVDFIANRSLDSGSAIFAFKNSTVSFIGGSNEDRNIVNIIGQFSRSHGGIVARFGSVIKMQNIIVNSFYNSSTYAGALNAEKSSFLVLENVSLNSISNYAEVGSAFLLNTESSATVVNADINFSSNVDKNNGAVFLDKSRAYFKNSGEIIISSNTAMSAGAVYLSVSTLTFDGAKKILFSNNTSSDAANSAGAIYLNNSILTFSNTEITFINNRHINGIKNDINLVNKSQLIFSGDVLLPNGVIVKNDGSSFLKKTKTGNLIFDGTAVINSSFAIEQGTASFRYGAKLSSVSFLDIGKTAALSFKDGFAGGMLFVKTLNLNGFIEVDADFTNATADSFNFAGAGSERNLIVNTSTIIVSRSGALEDSSPVPFINFGASLASFKNQFENNITVLGAGRHYGLSVDKQNNNLAKIMILPKWNWFADEYKKVKANETVYLDGWTIAAEQFDANGKANAVKIGTSINKTFFIDGNNYGLNASNFEGFGFVLQQSSITFKDISFSNFALSNSTGSVINAANSTLTFRGNIKFSSNGVSYNAEMLGGAFYAFRTKVNFEDANVEFSSNVGRGLATGGAITASYSSFSFVNSAISFLENTAFGMAAFNFIQESVISFINSNVSFLNNQAVYNSGAIRLDGSSKFFAQNSFLVFSGNSASNHLTGAFYLNSAYAQLSNSTVVFSNNSVQGDGGAVVIRSGAELVVKFSSLTFLSNKTAFRNLNTGVGTGGALSIITANSVVNISFSTVYFINNIANTGGALSNFGKLYVSNSLIYFTSNSAVQNDTSSFGSNGGALWLSTNSKSVFENSSVYFTSNSAAGYGGAIYLDENAVLSFINSDLNFIGNKDVKDGGAIYALKNSTISFRGASNENRNTVNIIGQVSNVHGGIVIRSSSVVKMQNIIVNSFYNSSTYAGTLNAEVTAFFVLENVKLNSMLNYAFTGTSFLLNSFSSATLINVDIDFSSNTDANRLGATFYVERSAIHLKNSGSIILSSNTASFSGAEASISGALRIDRATAVFDGAKEIIFANNLALSTLGQSAGAILLTASELTFSNTEIIFKNNFKNAGAEANDIFMNNSKLIFSGDNVLPNGVIIKESGKSIIRKIGEGSLTFEGFTSISSSFTIEQGTVNFRNNAAQSNVDILQISNGASLSFKDGSVGGILKVGESLSLGGFIEIDANFTGIGGTKGADYFSMIGGGANKKLTVAVTTVIVNRLDINQRSVDSVLFIDAGMDLSPLIDKLENIKVLGADRHYGITLGADKKQAVLALLPKWNFFVEDFKTALKGQTIYLYGQTFAADQKSAESVINAKPIGLTTGEFFIDGKGFSLNAQNSALQKLGFVLDKASVTFVNISLEGFLAQNSSGAAVFAQKSTLTFAGDISFLENTVFALANTGGGALFAKDAALNFEGNIKFSSNVSLNASGGAVFIDNSRLNFVDANVSFSSNFAQNSGGALFAKSSKVNFINSTVSFFSNQAQGNGAGIYLSLSTIIFTNTQSLFAQNTSNNTLNDIYFADKNSAVIFDGDNIISSGLIILGTGFIQKLGSKTLTFKGSLQAQESGFIAEGGFIAIDGKAALKNFYAIKSSAIFNDTFISNDISFGNSAASFLQAVITSSVNINKSTINFVQTLNSSGIFITNSLADFSSEVLASSVTLTNSSANFTGDANFRGDIFAEKSFSQFLSQVTAGGAIINNSTIIF